MTTEEIARLLLPLLVLQAKACQTITYSDLGRKVGCGPTELASPLGFIRDKWCIPAGIPEINVLVVGKNTGLPGPGFLSGGAARRLNPAEQRKEFKARKQHVCAYQGWDDLLEELGLK